MIFKKKEPTHKDNIKNYTKADFEPTKEFLKRVSLSNEKEDLLNNYKNLTSLFKLNSEKYGIIKQTNDTTSKNSEIPKKKLKVKIEEERYFSIIHIICKINYFKGKK
jgi:hypothetical protein